MVHPATGPALVELSPVGAFGKASAAGEFGVLHCSVGALPADIEAAGRAWLQVFLDTDNSVIAVAHRAADGWWLLRTEREPTPDTAGRRRGFVVLGRLTAEPDPGRLPDQIAKFAQKSVVRDDPPRTADPGDSLSDQRTPHAAATALALTLGHTAGVVRLEEAAAVLRKTGLSRLSWVALLPKALPVRLPNGAGLVISPQSLQIPAEIIGWMNGVSVERVFSLPLSRLRITDKTTLPIARHFVRAALGDESAIKEVWLDPTDAKWLVDVDVSRDLILGRLRHESLSDWLNQTDDPGDLDFFRYALKEIHQPAAQRLLRGRSDGFRKYGIYYPADINGASTLLSPDLAQTRLALLGALPPPAADAADLYFQTVSESSLAGELDMKAEARATAVGSRHGKQSFVSRLAVNGIRKEAAYYLLGDDVQPPYRDPIPRLVPQVDWLLPFPVDRWLVAMNALPHWREWLLQGVEQFLQMKRLTPEAILQAGLLRRDLDLLRLAGASRELVTFVDPKGGAVRLPPVNGDWPEAVNSLLAAALEDGTLFSRLIVPADESELFEWLASRDKEGEVFVQIARFYRALRDGDPADPKWIRCTVRFLSRRTVLRQVVAWSALTFDDSSRAEAIKLLIPSQRLRPNEQEWLTARTLKCVPLPELPDWSAEDMIDLFPLLDPVRDIVRVILSRPKSEPGEVDLLEKLRVTLARRPQDPPGYFPETAKVHNGWIWALCGLKGWAACVGKGAQIDVVRSMCQQLNSGDLDGLPENLRNAIKTLAGGQGLNSRLT